MMMTFLRHCWMGRYLWSTVQKFCLYPTLTTLWTVHHWQVSQYLCDILVKTASSNTPWVDQSELTTFIHYSWVSIPKAFSSPSSIWQKNSTVGNDSWYVSMNRSPWDNFWVSLCIHQHEQESFRALPSLCCWLFGGGKTVFCSDSMVIILRNSASFFGLDIILILIINSQCDRHQFQISCSRYLRSTIANTKRSDSWCCQKSQRDIKVCL